MSRRRRRRTLWDYLGTVPDHRKRRGVRFKLRSILALAFAAVLAGRKSLAAIARWAEKLEENKELLRQFDIERDEAPCHVTFHYVFKGLKVKAFERALSSWVKALAREDVMDHVAMDGKVLRGSRSGESEAVHLLAAYCEKVKGVVAQVEVSRGTNEITAAMKLLKGVPLEGAIVTGDAIFAQAIPGYSRDSYRQLPASCVNVASHRTPRVQHSIPGTLRPATRRVKCY